MPELPPAFLERLQTILPAPIYQRVLPTFAEPAATTFRINTLKSDEQLCDELAQVGIEPEEVDEAPLCYRIANEQRELLTHGPWQSRGELYVQDIGSVMIANALKVQPEEEVLDLAAAPGGKTLVLAAEMENRGRIAAVEPVKNRFFLLQDNLQTHGATLVDCYMKDGIKVGRQVPERFDRVLLDAPCSSESRFSLLAPESFQFWSEKKIAQVQRKQKQLLHSAITALKPGGRLIYSTCSFAPEENEAVVDRQLKLWGEQIDVLPLNLPTKDWLPGLGEWGKQTFDSRLELARRILPNGLQHGFFICALQKKATT